MLFTDELVFTHVPKTGGVAISNVLHRAAVASGKTCFGNYPISDVAQAGTIYAWANYVPWTFSYTHSGLADTHGVDEPWKDRKRIGSIRNPWDWYRSWYHYNRKETIRDSTGLITSVRFGGMSKYMIDTYACPIDINSMVERAANPNLLAGSETWPLHWPERAHQSLDYFAACKRMGCGLLTILTIRVLSERAYEIIQDANESDLSNGLLALLDYDALVPTETLADSIPDVVNRFGLAPIVADDSVVHKGERPNHGGQWQGTPYGGVSTYLSQNAKALISEREKHYIEAFGYTGPGSVPRSLVFYRGERS